MSRRIVQISAVAPGEGIADQLFALDNNGVAWVMTNPCASATWTRLPELPSLQNRSSPPAPVSPFAATEAAEP